LFLRSSGVLMPLFSLPGPFGIGVMGREADLFMDRLADMGCHAWQVLPLTLPASGCSPYSSLGAFSGSPLYIDPRGLAADGLISDAECSQAVYDGDPYRVDYEALAPRRDALLRLAFSRVGSAERDRLRDRLWSERRLLDLSLYMAIRNLQGGRPWYDWHDEDLKDHDGSAVAAVLDAMGDEVLYQAFTQEVFRRQWDALHARAGEKGISIIGDMPIYVDLDSADVWAGRRMFQMDSRGYPAAVSGVPPDYFSPDGQKWGNPLYDWDEMKKDGFSWWRERLGFSLGMFDAVRIDHFRGFASYFAIPAEAWSARDGEWRKGPGRELFSVIKESFPDAPIIAEDLGTFGEDVVELLEYCGYPGMRVMQFAFDPNDDSVHLPHNYVRNCVAYTGTHDNNTLLGWLYETGEEYRNYALDYCGFDRAGPWGEGGCNAPACRAAIRTLFESCADLAIVPFQDICGFGSDTRINVPSLAEGNWRWRSTADMHEKMDIGFMRELNRIYRRGNPLKAPEGGEKRN